MYYIYKIVNKLNGKKYFGQTQHPKKRWIAHKSDARKRPNRPLLKAISEFGEENFEFTIVQEWNTLEEVNRAEDWWIREFRTTDARIGYNAARGGIVAERTDAWIENATIGLKRYFVENPEAATQRGKQLFESFKKAYAEGRVNKPKGIPRTDEVKRKCSEANFTWYANNEYTEERKEKLRQSTIRQFSTEESRNKHSEVTREGMQRFWEEHPEKLEEHKDRCRKALAARRDPVTGRIMKKEPIAA